MEDNKLYNKISLINVFQFLLIIMSSSKTKEFAGPEFLGTDTLEIADTTDWHTQGGVEALRQTLDAFDWNGEAVMAIQLALSPDNKKVIGGKVHLVGELFKGTKDFRANRLFENADKDLRISYNIEEASTFSFSSGTLVGDILDSQNPGIQWNVYKKERRGEVTNYEEDQHGDLNIGKFSIHPFLIPLSAANVKLVIVAFPMSKEQLMNDNPEYNHSGFPGLELTGLEIDTFPLTDTEAGKSWGCPIVPLLLLGACEDDHPNVPSTDDIKAKISSIMQPVIKPETKRDLRSLQTAWQAVKDSGPSKLRERQPDLIWPLLEPNQTVQTGKKLFIFVSCLMIILNKCLMVTFETTFLYHCRYDLMTLFNRPF